MRFVFVGTGTLAILTSRLLSERGHEVVMIERSKEAIDLLSEEIDCGFIHGDATRPTILKEAGAEDTDLLFCLSHDDQANIITSLVARSLGFSHVVTKIEDPELEHICAELGLADSLVPMHTVGRYLADMAEGQDSIELSDIFRGDARVFSFRVRPQAAVRIVQLELPPDSRIICYYREGKFFFAAPDSRLAVDDEAVVLTDVKSLHALKERFGSITR